MEYFVFVYGTLLSEERNHHLLNEAIFIDKGYIENYYMYNLGRYPGINKTNRNCKVLGEVYKVNEKMMKDLDALEEEGYMYKKVLIPVNCDKNVIEAFVYEYILEKHEDTLNIDVYDWKKIK